MQNFFSNIVAGIGITDVIDIVIVAFILYRILGFIKETRAEQLIKGLLVLLGVTFVSDWAHLYTLNWLLRSAWTIGLIALVIIFQPELRRGLEYMGRNQFVRRPFGNEERQKAQDAVSELVRACDTFSANRVGALIVIERQTMLTDIVENGTIIDAQISAEVLGNIFYEGAPLHDGALIIRDFRAYAAGCVLPLTQNKRLSKDLGTRHRAGIGITENSDAVSLIVSEETGIISIAQDGKLTRFLDIKAVEKTLLNVFIRPESDGAANTIKKIFGRKDDVSQ